MRARDGALRRPPTQIPTIVVLIASIHIIPFNGYVFEHILLGLCTLRCFEFISCCDVSSQARPQPVLRHPTWCQVDVVAIQHPQRLARKFLAACCRLEDLVCWFGWDDTTQQSIWSRFGIRHPSGPLGLYVVDGTPEPRHPTPAGAASTGPPVPTGAATAVVAVHGLGGGLDRVRCRGTLALQDISRLCYSGTNFGLFRPSIQQKKCTWWEAHFSPRSYHVGAIYLPDLTAV